MLLSGAHSVPLLLATCKRDSPIVSVHRVHISGGVRVLPMDIGGCLQLYCLPLSFHSYICPFTSVGPSVYTAVRHAIHVFVVLSDCMGGPLLRSVGRIHKGGRGPRCHETIHYPAVTVVHRQSDYA